MVETAYSFSFQDPFGAVSYCSGAKCNKVRNDEQLTAALAICCCGGANKGSCRLQTSSGADLQPLKNFCREAKTLFAACLASAKVRVSACSVLWTLNEPAVRGRNITINIIYDHYFSLGHQFRSRTRGPVGGIPFPSSGRLLRNTAANLKNDSARASRRKTKHHCFSVLFKLPSPQQQTTVETRGAQNSTPVLQYWTVVLLLSGS